MGSISPKQNHLEAETFFLLQAVLSGPYNKTKIAQKQPYSDKISLCKSKSTEWPLMRVKKYDGPDLKELVWRKPLQK